jgi:prepilin-type N-terminal cleavage/methylation domain-containing protein
MKTIRRKRFGFTLVEICMVIVLVGIISLAMVRLYATLITTSITVDSTTDALAEARLALERMVVEIREIRNSSDITINTATQFSFVNVSGATITYALASGSLTSNGQVLATGINSLAFTYYTNAGVATTTGSAIRFIRITINVTDNSTNFTLTTVIYPRSLIV